MTLSEMLQANVIRCLLGGTDRGAPVADFAAAPLRCRNGLVLSVQIDGKNLAGPWGWFAVSHVEGQLPPGFTVVERMPASAIVLIMESAGWPETQLGRRWTKKPTQITRPR